MNDLISAGMSQSDAFSISAMAASLRNDPEYLIGWIVKIAAFFAARNGAAVQYVDVQEILRIGSKTYSKLCKMGVIITSEHGVSFGGFGPLENSIRLLSKYDNINKYSDGLSCEEVDRKGTMTENGANGKDDVTNVTKNIACASEKSVVPSPQQAEVGYIYNKEYIDNIYNINKEEYIYKEPYTWVGDKGVQGEKNLCDPENIPHCEKKKGRRIPDNWNPSQEDISFCLQRRPDLNPVDVAESFRDYWQSKPGASATKLDWSATWRNWVKKEPMRSAPKSFSDKRAEVIAKLTGADDDQPDAWTIEP